MTHLFLFQRSVPWVVPAALALSWALCCASSTLGSDDGNAAIPATAVSQRFDARSFSFGDALQQQPLWSAEQPVLLLAGHQLPTSDIGQPPHRSWATVPVDMTPASENAPLRPPRNSGWGWRLPRSEHPEQIQQVVFQAAQPAPSNQPVLSAKPVPLVDGAPATTANTTEDSVPQNSAVKSDSAPAPGNFMVLEGGATGNPRRSPAAEPHKSKNGVAQPTVAAASAAAEAATADANSATPSTATPSTAGEVTTAARPGKTDGTVESAGSAVLTQESMAARKTAVEQRTDLPDAVKTPTLKHLQRASELIQQKNESDHRAAKLKAEKENGPTRIAETRQRLTQPAPTSEPELPGSGDVSALEQLRLVDEMRLNEARRALETWEDQARLRSERKPQMPALIEATRKQLEDAEKALTVAAPDGEPAVLTQARRSEHEAAVLLLRSQLELYRAEQLRYETLNEWFPLQRDLLTRNRNAFEKRAELWKNRLTEARQKESVRQAREAREKLRNAHPTLRDLAESNSALTVRRRELQAWLAQRVATLSDIDATLDSVEQKFQHAVEKEDRLGLTTAVGVLLRSQRSHLPNAAVYHHLQADAEQNLVKLQTTQMQLEDERSALGDIKAKIAATLGTGPSSDATPNSNINVATVSQTRIGERSAGRSAVSVDSPTWSPELRQMAQELLTDRRKYLDDLLADYDNGLQTLGETDVACRRLVSVIDDFKSYIDERVLWIRSAAPVDSDLFQKTWRDIRSFHRHREWSALTHEMTADAYTHAWLYALILAALGVSLILQHKVWALIERLGRSVPKQLNSGLQQTLLATAFTILLASAWPAVLWFVSWRLAQSELSLAAAFSAGCSFCAAAFWGVNSFRGICRKEGVAASFLEWPTAIVKSLHLNLLLYLAGGLPLGFLVVAAGRLDEGERADSVGRVAFICFCGLLTLLLRKLVRPNGPVIGDFLRSSPESLMYRLRWLWYPMAIGSPVCLASLALMGYQYTAEQLMLRLHLTLGMSIVLLLTYTLAMQWMLTAKRNLALKQARARQAAALAAAARESEEDGSAANSIPPVEIPQLNLSLLNRQVLHFVQGSAAVLFLAISWGIWSQVLPALQVFSRYELWTIVVDTTENIDATGTVGATIREVSRVQPITLGHLLLGSAILIVAIVASQNIPGLLELVVLQRLPMDHGERNAITTLCRYALTLTGIIVASNTIGVSWGSVQWLIAALTVGLGFGLQEIFANFVSGLIILFERPVRIGDVVTIDGISGCVSRIQIRATTITDWDRKEYLVPNKEFVTGKLLNWTLSDKTNRVVIKVGIAYGSNTELALALLEQAATEHPLVLEDPAAIVGFESFGDSCLDLVLRCYLPNLDQRLKVISQLHITIDRLFREAGIEISFPQRDLHIRSFPAQLATLAQDHSVPQNPHQNATADSINNAPQTNDQDWKRSA